MSSEATPPGSVPPFPLQKGLPERRPFGGKRRLFNVARLRFPTSFLTQLYDTQMLDLNKGEQVVVETSRGPALATLTSEVHREIHPRQQLKKVLRRATSQDIQRAKENLGKEQEAFLYAIRRIRERKLAMKLVQVHCMHDNSRIVFYFSAEGRVDFRQLVKDLAHQLRTRIEMRQIGARDGARMIGGIGPCGRELCCSTFLEKFAPVSIRMAKEQGLTLNPRKVSGMCGRLMCCLVYEQQIYHKTRRRLPRPGKPVATPMGLGIIKEVSVLKESVLVSLDDGQRESFPVKEVILLTPRELEKRRDAQESSETLSPQEAFQKALGQVARGEDEYLWDDKKDEEKKPSRRRRRRRSDGGGAKDEGGDKSRSPRRSRRPGDKPKGGAQKGGAPKEANAKGADGNTADKPRRTRRRRRPAEGAKPSTGTKASNNQSAKPLAAEGEAPKRRRRRRRRPAGGGGGEAVPRKDAKKEGPKTDGPKKAAPKKSGPDKG